MDAPVLARAPTSEGAAKSVSRTWLRALEITARLTAVPGRTLPVLMDDLAAQFGDAPALLSDRESFTYRELAERARRYTRWALREGLQSGDAVALIMPNRPEYFAIWLGLVRTGAAVSLINTHLTGASLAHCLSIVRPRHIIVATALEARFAGAEPLLDGSATVWSHGAGTDRRRIDQAADLLSGEPLAPGSSVRSLSPTLLCISTPRAPPACPRRRTSAIGGCSAGAAGSPA